MELLPPLDPVQSLALESGSQRIMVPEEAMDSLAEYRWLELRPSSDYHRLIEMMRLGQVLLEKPVLNWRKRHLSRYHTLLRFGDAC